MGFPFYVFNFTADFEEKVIKKLIRCYECGATPNPCIDCNRHLKFDVFLNKALELGYEYIATGHYARIRKDPESGRFLLCKAADESKGGVGRALKFIFSHKQIRAVAICSLVFMSATGVTSYYESIMKTGGMDTAQVTRAMYFIPFFNAAMTLLGGFITDALGRKRSAVILSSVAFLGLVTFILCANFGMPPAAVGISYGLFIGGLWSVSDMLCIIVVSESTPTYLRASVLGAVSLIVGIGTMLSNVFITVGMLLVPSIGLLCLFLCTPFLLASILILITRVHETKGVDLNTVTGAEWD